jgi:hypothetical protein
LGWLTTTNLAARLLYPQGSYRLNHQKVNRFVHSLVLIFNSFTVSCTLASIVAANLAVKWKRLYDRASVHSNCVLRADVGKLTCNAIYLVLLHIDNTYPDRYRIFEWMYMRNIPALRDIIVRTVYPSYEEWKEFKKRVHVETGFDSGLSDFACTEIDYEYWLTLQRKYTLVCPS